MNEWSEHRFSSCLDHPDKTRHLFTCRGVLSHVILHWPQKWPWQMTSILSSKTFRRFQADLTATTNCPSPSSTWPCLYTNPCSKLMGGGNGNQQRQREWCLELPEGLVCICLVPNTPYLCSRFCYCSPLVKEETEDHVVFLMSHSR